MPGSHSVERFVIEENLYCIIKTHWKERKTWWAWSHFTFVKPECAHKLSNIQTLTFVIFLFHCSVLPSYSAIQGKIRFHSTITLWRYRILKKTKLKIGQIKSCFKIYISCFLPFRWSLENFSSCPLRLTWTSCTPLCLLNSANCSQDHCPKLYPWLFVSLLLITRMPLIFHHTQKVLNSLQNLIFEELNTQSCSRKSTQGHLTKQILKY